MYERILVPLDGSPLAEAIFPHARELTRRFSAELLLFQAITPSVELMAETATPTSPEISVEVAPQRVRAERETAERYLGGIGEQLEKEGIRVRTRVDEDAAAASILQVATEEKASLISLSTHGRGGLERLILGSVADEVVRHTQVPVLLLPVPAISPG